MRGLTIILTTDDETRLRSALGMALSHHALGGRARLFLDTDAAALLHLPIRGIGDAHYKANGLPPLAELVDEALAGGITITLCQAGMALAGMRAETLDPRLSYGGMVGVLADLGDDRLVTV